MGPDVIKYRHQYCSPGIGFSYYTTVVVVVVVVLRKIRTHLDLLSIPQSGGKILLLIKKKQNAPRPSEHPLVEGKNVKTLIRWVQRLQIQNLFMPFKRVPRWK